MKEIETFTLKTDRKYLNYIPNDNKPIIVYRYDRITNQWIELTQNIGLNLQDINQYVFIEDISCILFHNGLINSQIKIEYEHNNIKNPFLIHETIDLVDRMLELSKYKISESIYLTKSDMDSYSLDLQGGNILYNGDLYIIPNHTINFRYLGYPHISGQYYGYLLYIGSDVINHNLYKPLKLVKPKILRTNFVYYQDQFSHAKNELYQMARNNLLNKDSDKVLEIAYVFVSITKNSKNEYELLFEVDYPLTHRKI